MCGITFVMNSETNSWTAQNKKHHELIYRNYKWSQEKLINYIFRFEELARFANYIMGNKETTQLFLEGLTTQVMQDMLTIH